MIHKKTMITFSSKSVPDVILAMKLSKYAVCESSNQITKKICSRYVNITWQIILHIATWHINILYLLLYYLCVHKMCKCIIFLVLDNNL